MMHGGGWWSYLRYDESKGRARIDRNLLRRVLRYARPYWAYMVLVLVAIVATSLLGLIPPLLIRDLIDNVLPNRDVARLGLLALGMIGIPLLQLILFGLFLVGCVLVLGWRCFGLFLGRR